MVIGYFINGASGVLAGLIAGIVVNFLSILLFH
jgi:hypothetical protein